MAEIRELVCKGRDSWWTVLLVDPLAVRLVRWIARYTRITPDQVTWAALVLGVGAAGCFVQGGPGWLAAGALLYHLSFVLDCVDGKLARLQGSGTLLGGWLDYVLDRVRVGCCALALMAGQWIAQGEPGYLVLGALVVFLDMFRYLNVLMITQIRSAMRDRVVGHRAFRHGGPPVFIEQLMRQGGDPADAGPAAGSEVVDLHRGFRRRFPWYVDFRTRLLELRIRPHLVSGIEFQMAVFIVGPLLGQIVAATLVAGAAMAAFEAALVYKLLLSTRDLDLTVRDLSVQHLSVQHLSGKDLAVQHLAVRHPSGRAAEAPEPTGVLTTASGGRRTPGVE